MSETEKNEPEAVEDLVAQLLQERASLRAEIAELRAALGEACRLLGSSGRHAYPLDTWRKLAEGGK